MQDAVLRIVYQLIIDMDFTIYEIEKWIRT
jgi:hypothetical protein